MLVFVLNGPILNGPILNGIGPVAVFAQPPAEAKDWGGYAPPSTARAMSGLTAGSTAGLIGIPTEPAVQSIDATHPPRFILLKSGKMYEGTITPLENGYHVRLDFGSMTVSRLNVEKLAHDKLEIYRHKKANTPTDSWQELMKLADWALSNGFEDRGIEDYDRALEAAPNRQIAQFLTSRIQSIVPSSDAPSSDTKPADDSMKNSTGKTGAPDRSVQSVPSVGSRDFHGEKPTFPGSDILENEEQKTMEEELGTWIARLPKQQVEFFAKKVQPILVNRCASADCHGTHSSSRYQLAQPRLYGGTTTFKNMRATLKYVDPVDPAASELLVVPIRVHGGPRPIFSKQTQMQYEILQAWVESVAGFQTVPRDQPLHASSQPVGRVSPLLAADEQNMQPDICKDVEASDSTKQSSPNNQFHRVAGIKGPATPPKEGPSQFFEPPQTGDNPVSSVSGFRSLSTESGKFERFGESATSVEATFPDTSDPLDPTAFNRLYHPNRY